MTKAVWGAGIRLAGAVVLVLASVSCGDLTREGQSSSYLIINALEASAGNDASTFTTNLLSDVVTVVDSRPTYFNDVGRVTFALGLKDAGSASAPTKPTQANWVTVDRYHVRFIRSDGRNTPGVDVPYGFDGAFTVTVSGDVTGGFELVRVQAKLEAPLAALAANGVVISTIAEVTFYGHDQTGRDVSTVGRIGVDFANFADKN
jgi:hypothetical protein